MAHSLAEQPTDSKSPVVLDPACALARAEGHNFHNRRPEQLYAVYFGAFAIFRNDQIVPIRRNTLAARIGSYLIARSGLPAARDELVEWLWPNSDPESANHRLQVAVTELRHSLEDDPGRSRLVQFEGGAYSIPAAMVVTDCDLFERYYRRAQSQAGQGRIDAAVADYSKAIELYSADYLADDPYADWASRRRDYFSERRLNALSALCDLAAISGRWEAVLDHAQRIIEIDDLRERAHRHVMRAHYRVGQRACAIRHYQICRDAIWRELAVEPSRATVQLYRAVVEERELPDEPFTLAG